MGEKFSSMILWVCSHLQLEKNIFNHQEAYDKRCDVEVSFCRVLYEFVVFTLWKVMLRHVVIVPGRVACAKRAVTGLEDVSLYPTTSTSPNFSNRTARDETEEFKDKEMRRSG